MRPDRCAATPIQGAKQRPLRLRRHPGGGTFDGREQLGQRGIAGAGRDADDPLASGRQHEVGVEHEICLGPQPQPPQAGEGEEACREIAIADPAEAGLDIAADDLAPQIGAPREQLGLPADRGRADQRAMWQAAERIGGIARAAGGAEDDRVARILTRQHAGQDDAGRQLGLQVLQRMHRAIDLPVQQGFVDFLGEQTLAADIGQALVLDAVASGGDHLLDEALGPAQPGAGGADHGEEMPGLPKGERRAAGADPQDGAGLGAARGGGASRRRHHLAPDRRLFGARSA